MKYGGWRNSPSPVSLSGEAQAQGLQSLPEQNTV